MVCYGLLVGLPNYVPPQLATTNLYATLKFSRNEPEASVNPEP